MMKHNESNNTQTPDIILTDHVKSLALIAALMGVKVKSKPGSK